MTVNKVILVGNLGADPETRTSQAGNMIANLRLATSDRRKDREGNWTDHTEWHRVVCFGRTAENVAKFCRKGKQIYVEGRIQTQKWTDREGKDRWTTEIVANEIRFLGRKDDGGGYGGGGGSYGGGGSSYGGGGGGSSYQGGGGGGDSASGGSFEGGGGAGAGQDDDIPF